RVPRPALPSPAGADAPIRRAGQKAGPRYRSSRYLSVQCLLEREPGVIPPPPHRPLRDSQEFGGLNLRQPVVPEQVKDFSFLVAQPFNHYVKIGPFQKTLRLA